MRPTALGTAILLALAAPPAGAQQPEIPLPVIEDDGWALLADVVLTEHQTEDGDWRVDKTFPEALLEAAQEPFTITGYIVPVTSEPVQRTILLVRNTEDCPFCGSGGYSAPLEVWMAEPIRDVTEFDRVTITGALQLVEDPGTLQTAVLTAARLEP